MQAAQGYRASKCLVVWLQSLWGGAGPLRVGTVTHLPEPWGTGERPPGAGAAASSQRGCPVSCCPYSLLPDFEPLGEEGR